VTALAASLIALFAWIAACLSASRGSVRPA
jgi:hypothetical protein